MFRTFQRLSIAVLKYTNNCYSSILYFLSNLLKSGDFSKTTTPGRHTWCCLCFLLHFAFGQALCTLPSACTRHWLRSSLSSSCGFHGLSLSSLMVLDCCVLRLCPSLRVRNDEDNSERLGLLARTQSAGAGHVVFVSLQTMRRWKEGIRCKP